MNGARAPSHAPLNACLFHYEKELKLRGIFSFVIVVFFGFISPPLAFLKGLDVTGHPEAAVGIDT